MAVSCTHCNWSEDLLSHDLQSHELLSHDLLSHDLVRQALLAGEYAVPRLPEIPVDKILDHAEYWKWVECSTNRFAFYPSGRLEYLRLSVPPPEDCMKVKKVEITCTAHCQGCSSCEFFINRSTHRHLCTWGKVSILATCSEGVKEFRRNERLHTNLRKFEKWQVHHCSFGENSEFVSSLVPGSSEIVFYLNSPFPGWQNYAKSATIKIMFV